MSEQLPLPKVQNWERLYQPDAQVRCIKDDPPMKGFGRVIKSGDVIDIKGLCWEVNHYQISVPSECAFYDLEGFFEVEEQAMSEVENAKVVIENGVLDFGKSAVLAKKKVTKNKGVPVHACGLQSPRDCPCWTCTSRSCQACMASMF